MLETSSGDFHSAGDFFGGIFTVLETSSGILTVLETFLDRFSRCWRLLLEIFKVLETLLEGFSQYWRLLLGFSRCWRLLWKDFHDAGDFWDFQGS